MKGYLAGLINDMENNKISKFWTWFLANKKRLENYANDQRIISEVDNRILRLGNFNWELGPGICKEYALTISPNRSKQLLDQTKLIIYNAPKLANWEFHYAKPLKKFKLFLKTTDSIGEVHSVNANNWRYVLLEYENKKFGVLVKIDFTHKNEGFRNQVVDLMFESIIGEEYFIRFIEHIDIIKEFESEYLGKSSNLKFLNEHIESLINN